MASIRMEQKLSIGSIVWGKLGSFKWWPGILVNYIDIGLPKAKFGSFWVFWFGDYKVSQLPTKNIAFFTSSFKQLYKKNVGKCHQAAVNEALEVLATRFDYCYKSPKDLLLWAVKGFKAPDTSSVQGNENKKTDLTGYLTLKATYNIKEVIVPLIDIMKTPDLQKHSPDIPPFVLKHLQRIQNINKKLSEAHISTPVIAEKKNLSPKFVQVKKGSLKLQDVCIACFGSNVEAVSQHPLFEGGICLKCQELLKETIFAVGSDGKNVCCVICAHPGSLILCDSINCSRSYCFDCIGLWLGEETRFEILERNPWLCFFCVHQNSNQHYLLKIKLDWEKRLQFLFQQSTVFVDELSKLSNQIKRPIRVLSLFDGISTGKAALDSLGIVIDQYYASEIDESAINVSKLNHPGSIIYIGDITKIDESKIEAICPIDLLIGGSPCNDLSLVNPKRKGIYDFSGTGPLFFDYFHICKTIERLNGRNNPLLFLFENVASMRLVDKSVISSFLMMEPILIDAKSFSAQSRPRLFWGNIPGISLYRDFYDVLPINNVVKEPCQLLGGYLLEGFERKATVAQIRTVTTNKNSLIQDNYNLLPVEMNGEPDQLWITELEKIFGFPPHYTDTGNLTLNKRRELLGKSWSMPVIINILRSLHGQQFPVYEAPF
ncbi:hypothetical protein JTE90_016756 [Oedothorax gibbosus]|uniref:DNA (cytosine-5-)-methyltransferase n=1 Tax=Oedothorax gibbosus TaxID=931172 RepID=A0AAV6VX91_9ARAC|nr:hypothetical protein JTE90_016756 [Oedothorax gibbosus]